jgi:predicted ATPase
LITITGIGGMGKTRLALATARRFLHPTTNQPVAPFADGIYFIDLVSLTAPDQMETAVANVLHLHLTAGNDHSSRQQLIDYLSSKRVCFKWVEGKNRRRQKGF